VSGRFPYERAITLVASKPGERSTGESGFWNGADAGKWVLQPLSALGTRRIQFSLDFEFSAVASRQG
jgi:hypothetical protein